MERNDILARVQEVFREELELDDLVLSDETTADDVEEWDSLSILSIIATLSEKYNISLSSEDIKKVRTVSDLVELIDK